MPRRKRRRQRGAAAVEFALVLPVFLLLVLGTIDFGYYFFVSEIVTNAAREGARAGSVLPPTAATTDVEQEAETVAGNYLAGGGLTSQGVTATTTVVNGVNAVQVNIAYPVGSVTGFLSGIMPTYSNAQAVMRWQ
jgi:Flp pilus assembly protein TadG